MKNLFTLLFFLSLFVFPSSNNMGQLGYFNTPSAFTLNESSIIGNISLTDNQNSYSLTISPFNFMDVSIFYHDLLGVPYGGGYRQNYKDKGISLKLRIKDEGDFPAISIGLNDIGGTGYSSSEYVVMSRDNGRIEYSFGFGWGSYSEGITFANPLIEVDSSFSNRRVGSGLGGTSNSDNAFSGKNAALFGAIKYKLNKNLSIYIEQDPYKNIRANDQKNISHINFGAAYTQKNYELLLALDKFNNLGFSFFFKKEFGKFSAHSYVRPLDYPTGLAELRVELEKNNIGLSKVESFDKDLFITLTQNSYQKQHKVNSIVFDLLKDLKKEYSNIHISQKYLDMEIVSTFYRGTQTFFSRNEQYSNKDKVKKEVLYENKIKFPIYSNYIFPTLRTQIASREGFLYRGLMLEDNFEVLFSENFLLLSNFKYSISDNFDGLHYPPIDTYPNQVRSDIKSYLNNFDNGVIIGRLEANYFKSFKREHFIRVSAGIFEEMFSGIGFDYLYYPEGSLVSFGFESYIVKKRDYKLRFGTLKYRNLMSRASVMYTEPLSNIQLKISFGEYLAGDSGYTIEAGRRFENGISFSGFISKTNVTYQQFGEGSFDKGIRFKIPFSLINSLFGNNQNLSTYEWRPLTKDPAALLNKSVDLDDEVFRYRVY